MNIYYKELTYMIMMAGKICSVGQHSGDPGEPMVQIKSVGIYWRSPFSGKLVLFYSVLQLIE